jgi:vacuolar-type H+-ATPase subunit D/Vma8
MQMPKTKLELLKEKRARLQARIAEIEAKGKVQTRKEDTRLKVIAGAACLADAAMHDETKRMVRGILDRAVKAPRDRDFLKSKGWL